MGHIDVQWMRLILLLAMLLPINACVMTGIETAHNADSTWQKIRAIALGVIFAGMILCVTLALIHILYLPKVYRFAQLPDWFLNKVFSLGALILTATKWWFVFPIGIIYIIYLLRGIWYFSKKRWTFKQQINAKRKAPRINDQQWEKLRQKAHNQPRTALKLAQAIRRQADDSNLLFKVGDELWITVKTKAGFNPALKMIAPLQKGAPADGYDYPAVIRLADPNTATILNLTEAKSLFRELQRKG